MAILAAMAFGFNGALAIGAAVYSFGFLAARRLGRERVVLATAPVPAD